MKKKKEKLKQVEEQAFSVLAHARAYLKKKAPYIASTVYGLVPHFQPGMALIAGGPIGVTKGMVMLVDPFWAATLKPEVMAACIYHECMHLLRGIERVERLGDPHLANLAGDLAINPDLRNAGWELPAWVAYPDKYGFEEGLTLEQYYELLKQEQEKGGLQQLFQNLPGPPQQGGQGGGQGDGEESDENGDGQGGKGEGTAQGQNTQGHFGAGRCGSCAGNGLTGLEDQVDKEIGRNQADIKRIRKQAIQEIKGAMEGLGRGTMPAGMEQFIDFEETQKTIDWRQRLRSVIRKATGRMIAGRADFSLRRPSKRSYLRGIVRPGMVDKKVNMAFVRDTSGSMGMEQLKAANNEILQLFKQMGIESAWFMDCDAQAYAPQQIRMKDIPRLKITGRGGTSFVPAIQACSKLRPLPDVVVYLTDGDGDAPQKKPKGYEVVWCIVPTPNGRRPANWGHTVVVSEDQKLSAPYYD